MRIPGATYRLQFGPDFGFDAATKIVDYLRDLGITDCYASPIFCAGGQSTHGYDVCNPQEVSPALGGSKGFEALISSLRSAGLGLLLDIVPNHMRADCDNPWWRDVLEHGPESEYAGFFDIDWKATPGSSSPRVLLPVLEDHYYKVLTAGKLRLDFKGGAFVIAYYDRIFPLAPHSCKHLASFGLVDSVLTQFNRDLDKLHELLEQQHYRLAWWRVGLEELNYRRFFDVTELVALRMEVPEVFEATHKLVFELVSQGKVTGLRIDHPDGLWDPEQYFHRLQHLRMPLAKAAEDCRTPKPAGVVNTLRNGEAFGVRQSSAALASTAVVTESSSSQPVYIVTEKILSGSEKLCGTWPVAGTTGYEFLNCLNGIFVDAESESQLDRTYRDFTGQTAAFRSIVSACKKQILTTSFQSELNALTTQAKKLAASSREGQDLRFSQLRAALIEVIAAFPVYRTYIRSGHTLSPIDRGYIERAIVHAKLDLVSLEFIKRILLLEFPSGVNTSDAGDFVMRFQQLSGPIMAKGLEDTAFYRYHRLISLNEVGGQPDRFGVSVSDFHAHNAYMAEHWSHTLLATATHDTKRGEDLRARLNVLSEMPEEWANSVTRWREINASKKRVDANTEYLLYQTLLGAWPVTDSIIGASFVERIQAYVLKAVREAKEHTSWLEPNLDYESSLSEFISDVLANQRFVEAFTPLQRKVAFFGRFNSLSQVVLKLTCPGVPDFYQGSELWDLNLVDPDNRRPVDYELRRTLLANLAQESLDIKGLLSRLLKHDDAGESKLFVINRVLQFRNKARKLFDEGKYLPLQASGERAEHICAFARLHDNDTALIVAPRLYRKLLQGQQRLPLGHEVWRDTLLPVPKCEPGATLRNVVTGETVRVSAEGLKLAEVLSSFPVAVLMRA